MYRMTKQHLYAMGVNGSVYMVHAFKALAGHLRLSNEKASCLLQASTSKTLLNEIRQRKGRHGRIQYLVPALVLNVCTTSPPHGTSATNQLMGSH